MTRLCIFLGLLVSSSPSLNRLTVLTSVALRRSLISAVDACLLLCVLSWVPFPLPAYTLLLRSSSLLSRT